MNKVSSRSHAILQIFIEQARVISETTDTDKEGLKKV